ncbi:hypothetical protein B0H17DRAFT_1331188 [Mycena rosella]|uniref:Uncharacterized protein n=1 Tax=Mycena rosella TaxID=1033263 RepID=A0AAD7GHH3_MYCRO|nr:hypothetical protein B0H17DRAFT_1331188 [Mycena rosella]
MADVQAHTARLIALFVSCVLYGMLLTTFVPCIRSLLFSASRKFQFKPRHEIKFPIVVATTLMFLVSTFSAVLSMQDVIDAFIDYQGPGGALEFYNIGNHGWKHWMPVVDDTIQVVLGDALLIYRCYVIYDRNWRAIALPAVSWMAMAGLSLTASYREANLHGAQRLNDATMIPILSATLLLTLTTSITTTYLIVRRLFTADADLRGAIQPHFLTRVGMIFFETGMIYTLTVIASLGVYLSGSNLEFVVSLAIIHIIPLTCNLLLIRVEGINRPVKGIHMTSPSLRGEIKFNPQAAEELSVAGFLGTKTATYGAKSIPAHKKAHVVKGILSSQRLFQQIYFRSNTLFKLLTFGLYALTLSTAVPSQQLVISCDIGKVAPVGGTIQTGPDIIAQGVYRISNAAAGGVLSVSEDVEDNLVQLFKSMRAVGPQNKWPLGDDRYRMISVLCNKPWPTCTMTPGCAYAWLFTFARKPGKFVRTDSAIAHAESGAFTVRCEFVLSDPIPNAYSRG